MGSTLKSIMHLKRATRRAVSNQAARDMASTSGAYRTDPREAEIDKCYRELYFAIVTRAVEDYVNFSPANRRETLKKKTTVKNVSNDITQYWITARRFLGNQENIDILDLHLDSDDLLRMLDRVTPNELKKRLANTASAAIPWKGSGGPV